jgi:DNA repair photolyase
MSDIHKQKGRGALSREDSRFSDYQRSEVDDGWFNEDAPSVKTQVMIESAKTIITQNQSPDLPFSQSINAYRGCEHGCIYCYARPSHAYLDLSPGLDFETKLMAKPNAATLLRKELQAKNYQCSAISLGANTDPYQPIEKQYQITREVLEVLYEHKHPCTIVTKSAMVERDIDILQKLAKDNLVSVTVSITTLRAELARTLEPRASTPKRRLQAIQTLAENDIPVGVFVAPVIPVLTDIEMESIIVAAHQAGASHAEYILLRLPLEVTPLFEEWLAEYVPDQAQHIMNRVRDSRDGKTNDARFGHRLQGHGFYADMIQQRFRQVCRKTQINDSQLSLNSGLFSPHPNQLSLF